MWDKLVNCIKGGAGSKRKAGCQGVNMAELMKQCPPNQLKQFKIFAKKHEEYKERVRKYPQSLPAIDWEYYRKNVRPEFEGWVKKFETKYDKLHSLFENRHAIVDHKRYFNLVDEELAVVKKDICDYKNASDERIKKLTERLEFLKALKPYDQMTMEEFCFARPLLAPDFINKPTFWPHTPEEQLPGPSDPEAAAARHEEHEPPEPPKKPPPPAAQPEDAAAPKKPPSDTTKNAEATSSELAEQATKIAKDLFEKATVLFYSLKEKMSALTKDVQKKAEAAKAARAEAKSKSSDPYSAPSSQTTLDSHSERDSKPNICNQTIIRSADEEPNPEIKARHTDLSIEADPCEAEDERIRQKTRDLERRRQKEEQRERDGICQPVTDPCKPKKDPCESMEKESEAQPDPSELKDKEPVCDPCESIVEEVVCEEQPCKPEKEEAVCEPESDPRKPKGDESGNAEKEHKDSKDWTKPTETEQVYISLAKCSEDAQKKKEEKKSGDKPKECASLTEKIEGKDQKLIIGQNVAKPKRDGKATIEEIIDVGPVYTDPNQIVELLAKEKEAKMKAMEAARIEKASKPDKADKPVTIYPRREITGKAKTKFPKETKKTSEELAKDVHSMAKGAASLLSEASNILDDLKKNKEVRLEVLEMAYINAQRQALGALAEASKAVNAANKLAQRSREAKDEVSSQDLVMAEKHAVVAKMLANRAVALKDEIARVLKDLKKKG
ncbi:hypothetical protein KR032_007852 [Drosophila birchii]|nr:hypothetical protein KR032_007852 [Drosophila birchii]